ncbi:dTDP-4-dehydrorhamnose 3,5-epimerase [Sphingomonas sp. DG1-23]|uniref:dTDP-4-dehydrorhamnose 3,5-epimerase n=1 Tax=Sphingomonas sp. DG1-23 TaxID=3068316 RepID=UPI00273E4FC5|nr:dTDP-4-dehydrorhamnose 3,5-epimerase [Sphingomonas sp. DG1-23]MDP5278757.1 dTDP-4-dehydrorhamnose 3,5-epimerase [Sphingomonas sp. DG1-23]
MKLLATDLANLFVIEPEVYGDDRGFFMESWSSRTFAELGLDVTFAQDNHSRSASGVLRGIHYQIRNPQGKLVRVTAGRVFDVAVDLRRSSPTFGKWFGTELSGKNKRMLWVPPGFGHAFLSLADDTDFLYKCSGLYSPDDERCIAWNDPDLGIEWPAEVPAPTVSARDRKGVFLRNAEVYP